MQMTKWIKKKIVRRMDHFGPLLKIHYEDIMRTQEDKSGAHWGSAHLLMPTVTIVGLRMDN